VVRDTFRDAAEERRSHSAAASRADNDQVGALGIRDGHDLVDRVTGDALERVRNAGLLGSVSSFLEGGLRLVDFDVVRSLLRQDRPGQERRSRQAEGRARR
jgi:hypothetical protein